MAEASRETTARRHGRCCDYESRKSPIIDNYSLNFRIRDVECHASSGIEKMKMFQESLDIHPNKYYYLL